MESNAKKVFIRGGRKIYRNPPARWNEVQRKWNGRETEYGKKGSGKKRGNGNEEIAEDVTRVDEGRVGTLSEDEEPMIVER